MHPGLDRLRAVIGAMDSVVVTFSGGVDSALVARVAHDVLGARAIALTAVSPTFPPEELETARKLADECGFRLLEVDAHELDREGYAANAGNRCYFCKTELFDIAALHRDRLGFAAIADGTILDDLAAAHRPGLKASAEHAVRHPLVDAELDKEAVRAIARELNMSVWDKPSFACLGSRFPAGTRVTAEKVARVAHAETALRKLGIGQLRVRWHEITPDQVLARIEVDPDRIAALMAPGVREAVTTACREAGFRWVTLDLEGYTAPKTLIPSASTSKSSSSGSPPTS